MYKITYGNDARYGKGQVYQEKYSESAVIGAIMDILKYGWIIKGLSKVDEKIGPSPIRQGVTQNGKH